MSRRDDSDGTVNVTWLSLVVCWIMGAFIGSAITIVVTQQMGLLSNPKDATELKKSQADLAKLRRRHELLEADAKQAGETLAIYGRELKDIRSIASQREMQVELLKKEVEKLRVVRQPALKPEPIIQPEAEPRQEVKDDRLVIPPETAYATVVSMLKNDPGLLIRQAAAEAMPSYFEEHDEVLGLLMDAAEDDAAIQVRVAAIDSLGKIGEPSSIMLGRIVGIMNASPRYDFQRRCILAMLKIDCQSPQVKRVFSDMMYGMNGRKPNGDIAIHPAAARSRLDAIEMLLEYKQHCGWAIPISIDVIRKLSRKTKDQNDHLWQMVKCLSALGPKDRRVWQFIKELRDSTGELEPVAVDNKRVPLKQVLDSLHKELLAGASSESPAVAAE